MFFQRDYVLRMIEMMGVLIRRICEMTREIDARAELDEIAVRACGMPLRLLRGQSPQALAGLLDDPQRFLAAELMLISIEIDRRRLDEASLWPDKEQAIGLFSTLRDPDYLLPAADHVKALLDDALTDAGEETLLAAAALLEGAGEFAAAEDALFTAAEQNPARQADAIAFYARLDAASDAALRSGGLTRAEVDEGREALRRLASSDA